MNALNTAQRLRRRKLLIAGFKPEEIRFYGLLDKSDAEIATYLPVRFHWKYQFPAINTEMNDLFKDKWASQLFLNAVGIRMPELFGLWHPQTGMFPGGQPLRNVADFSAAIEARIAVDGELDLFFKPQSGSFSINAFRAKVIRTQSGIEAHKSDGTVQSLEILLSALPQNTTSSGKIVSDGWLIQKRVTQHPDVAALNPNSLNTARVVTYWDLPQDGKATQPYLEGAYLRVGREGYDTDMIVGHQGKDPDDAASTGGVEVQVDLQTGRMSQGGYGWRTKVTTLDRHPDTGHEFSGRQLPFWKEVEELCCKAARSFPGVRSIGWDIAFTPDGPLLVEGNSTWSLPSMQAHKGYLNPERRARFARENIPLPPTELPSMGMIVLERLKYTYWKLGKGR